MIASEVWLADYENESVHLQLLPENFYPLIDYFELPLPIC